MQELSERPVDTFGKICTTFFEVFVFTITQNEPSLTIDQRHRPTKQQQRGETNKAAA
jgi:hypothetical protein